MGVTTLRQWIIVCAIYDNEGITTGGLTKVIRLTNSDENAKPSNGIVHSACSRLEEAGFIRIERVQVAGKSGKPRRFHYLTSEGEELARLGVSL
jgi:DNA-binding PadR family transcriptional regulator